MELILQDKEEDEENRVSDSWTARPPQRGPTETSPASLCALSDTTVGDTWRWAHGDLAL